MRAIIFIWFAERGREDARNSYCVAVEKGGNRPNEHSSKGVMTNTHIYELFSYRYTCSSTASQIHTAIHHEDRSERELPIYAAALLIILLIISLLTVSI